MSLIKGLHLPSDVEDAIRNAFLPWADHVRAELREGGLVALLSRYEALVRSVETQSCPHSEVWSECCGWAIEYQNDLAVRDAIEIILTHTRDNVPDPILQSLAELDARLRIFMPSSLESGGAWWRNALPRGVVP